MNDKTIERTSKTKVSDDLPLALRCIASEILDGTTPTAEGDRLREAADLIEQWEVLSLVAICKERDRLQSALEKISEYAWLDDAGNEVAQPPWVELARKALAGAAEVNTAANRLTDETDDKYPLDRTECARLGKELK